MTTVNTMPLLDTLFPQIRRTLLVLAPALLAMACSVNPATGERQLALISESQEIELGRSTAAQAEKSLGLVDDAGLQQYVSDIGLRLAADSERPELPWRFGVIDDPVPNAFALPGGFIYVTRGMLTLMNSEAELAAVLGHEIGHVTARHSVAQMSRNQLAQIGLGVGTILYPEYRPVANVAAQGLQLLMLKYGRDAERQADELGFAYAHKQNYDMTEMADVFRALQRSGELAGRSSLPDWLSTHPGEEERIETARARAAAVPASVNARVGRDQFLAAIDGMVYGDNPRHGFFDDGYFIHPDMAFRFAVPQDWKSNNSTAAVQAISAGQDAMLQLTLASGSPEEATQAFFAQQGVQSGGSGRDTFNGVPAVISQFRAATEQGNVQGLVAYYRHGNQTLQLLTYAPQARFGSYDREFRSILASFGPVTDPAILNVAPATLDVVTLDRSMTLASFAERYSPGVDPERIALINGIENSASRLAAGSRLKRVQGKVL